MSMADSKMVSRVLLLAMAMAAAAQFAGSSPAEASSFCMLKQSTMELILTCENSMKKEGPKVEPSKECCAEMQKFDMTCFCMSLSTYGEKFLSMEKVVYAAHFCGKKVPSGTKCGSYVVPPTWRGRIA